MLKCFLKRTLLMVLAFVLSLTPLMPAWTADIEEMTEEELTVRGYATSFLLWYCSMPEVFGADTGLASYDFSGTLNSDNADRLIYSAVCQELIASIEQTEVPEGMTEDSAGQLIVSEAAVSALLSKYFSVTAPDVSLCSTYDQTKKAVILSGIGLDVLGSPIGNGLDPLQDFFRYSVNGDRYKIHYSFINSDRSHSVQAEFEISVLDMEMGLFRLYSFKINGENRQFDFETGSSFHIEKNWYLSGLREKTPVDQFVGQLSVFPVLCLDEWGELKTDGYIGTGDSVVLGEGVNRMEDLLFAVVRGDLNGDGRVTSTDYITLKKFFGGVLELFYAYAEAADVDGNGKISSADYIKIKKYMGGTTDLYT